MRVFERRSGERIRIGDEVEIRVLEARDGRVRLGIEAPRDARIMAVEDDDDASSTPGDESAFDRG